MIKNYLLSGMLLFSASHLFSQNHYNDQWYFGQLAGLDFSSGAPVAIGTSAMAAGEGSATVADSTTGALLFYTDGQTVWNKNNVIMPNGTGLMGGMSSTQAALIVPNPGSSTQFFIFTTDQIGGALGLRLSGVDMTLDGGNGDVVFKNLPLKSPVAEKVTAAQQPGTSNIWVVTHGWNNDAFYAFRVTPTGIDSAVVSNVGIVHDNSAIQNSYGQMKFNPCGDKLALAAGYLDKVEIFDFNPATGVVSNAKTISYLDHVYGVEFSQNSDVLYVTTYQASATLIQYDLTISNVATMIASAQIISGTEDLYPLQRARDGKIYVGGSFSPFISVINSPDNIGTSCNYVDNAINLDPGGMGINSGIGFPNFVQSFMGGTQFCDFTTAVNENHLAGMSNVFPNPSGSDFVFSSQQNNLTVLVKDVSGQLLETHTQVPMGGSLRFGQHYPAGVYLVNVIDENGNAQVLKVLKTR